MNKERAGGIIFALFGLLVFLFTFKVQMPANLNEPGPRIFPFISGVGMFLCGLGMALTSKKGEVKPFLSKEGWIKLLKVFAVLIIYLAGLFIFGFLISTPFFTFGIILLLADKSKSIKKSVTVVVALLTTGLIYWLFEKLFQIMLPAGILFEMFL